uniref:Thioesterase domain-containing protein n=1 Tax=Pyramimonas obovata TaxID=1411642 RepID=A0A7S0N7Z9_9CHLO|mmetsp:Transcript_21631/g.47515  ORF Transcript_21631/g.47515 Transcript_21631/m.47515 type:complete len:411 (+) Transcript_21631:385-1617(+)|eukprot:CAMPEP_0118928352 /NCGR_PEP_ID=MMETSP1169-20130426/5623_1 /TAXON_ID=36882 /ORGANISM="Pyramimonas obovata, Strain CCMP722" /LENGTH=410 /DNA_ID=CAMNT_0006870301 /DNA_START=332 /DNA_END=1564 /DNA_ORIENTATION=+
MGNTKSNQPLLEEDERARALEEEGVSDDSELESEDEHQAEMWEAASWSAFLQKPFPGVRSCTPDEAERIRSTTLGEQTPPVTPINTRNPTSPSARGRSRAGEALPLTPSKTNRKWSDDSLVHVEAVKQGKYSTACLRAQRPLPNARLRLFTFPYACGSFSSLLQCVKHLPDDVEVWLFEYPGHGSRHAEPPAESMQQIIDEEVQAILPLLDKPTVFFGHSMGSHVMFKVAQALYAAGQPIPIHLIASGRTPPHMLHPDRQALTAGGAEAVRQKMEMKMVEWGMGPEKLGEETHRRQLSLLVECCKILGSPCPPTSIPAPITVYWGEFELLNNMALIRQWGELSATNQFKLREFQGGHYYFNEGGACLSVVRECISEDVFKYAPAPPPAAARSSTPTTSTLRYEIEDPTGA